MSMENSGQEARLDPNNNPGLIAHSGTAGTAATERVVASEGSLHVFNTGGAAPLSAYNNIAVSYPDGTTEVFTYKLGTVSVGTVTVSYLDAEKGSLNTVIRS